MHEQLISQALTPTPDSFITDAMAFGAPSLPAEFTWKEGTFQIKEILQQWRESGPCRNGASERYLRKHWFRIRTRDDTEMKLYFERQPRSKSKNRWQLYSIIRKDAQQ